MQNGKCRLSRVLEVAKLELQHGMVELNLKQLVVRLLLSAARAEDCQNSRQATNDNFVCIREGGSGPE